MTSHAARDLAAELRALEEGHQARLATFDGRPVLLVKSDSTDGLYYAVEAHGTSHGLVVFTCTPVRRATGYRGQPAGHRWWYAAPERGNPKWHDTLTGHPGFAKCKHMARAARRLHREGLIDRHPGIGGDTVWSCLPLPDPEQENP